MQTFKGKEVDDTTLYNSPIACEDIRIPVVRLLVVRDFCILVFELDHISWLVKRLDDNFFPNRDDLANIHQPPWRVCHGVDAESLCDETKSVNVCCEGCRTYLPAYSDANLDLREVSDFDIAIPPRLHFRPIFPRRSR